MQAKIKLINIRKKFKGKVLFSDLSYTFNRGVYHLKGANGVGKSTLLKMITGLEQPDDGSILISGRSHCGNINENNNHIFYVPDDVAIYPFLQGIEFLLWIAKARTSNQDEVNDVLERFNLMAFKNTLIRDMSLGTKRKFLLATALIGQPDFIILDEPLNGLDVISQTVLLSILKERAENTGIILTTHHDKNIGELSPKEIVLSDNKIYEISYAV